MFESIYHKGTYIMQVILRKLKEAFEPEKEV